MGHAYRRSAWNYQRVAAEKVVRKLSGVVGVTNDIRVKPNGIPEDMRGEIVDALKRGAELDANSIMVVVHNDRLTLLGKVKIFREHGVAERAAWSAPGVTAVEDRLYIG